MDSNLEFDRACVLAVGRVHLLLRHEHGVRGAHHVGLPHCLTAFSFYFSRTVAIVVVLVPVDEASSVSRSAWLNSEDSG